MVDFTAGWLLYTLVGELSSYWNSMPSAGSSSIFGCVIPCCVNSLQREGFEAQHRLPPSRGWHRGQLKYRFWRRMRNQLLFLIFSEGALIFFGGLFCHRHHYQL